MSQTTEVEEVKVSDGLNRVLGESIFAPTDMPPFDASAMDGYAITAADLEHGLADRKFVLVGTSWAGRPFSGLLKEGQIVRVFTGAAVPVGTAARRAYGR